MSISLRSISIGTILFCGMSSVVWPEDSCQVLDKYVHEAAGNFQNLKGRQVDDGSGDEMYEANAYLPGATTCRIEEGTYRGNWQVHCKYLFENENERDVSLNRIRAAIARCAGIEREQLGRLRKHGYRGIPDIDISVRPLGPFDGTVSIEHVTDAQIDQGD